MQEMWVWSLYPLQYSCLGNPHGQRSLVGYNPAAAASAKLHQSCPTLWDPTDGSPPGSPVPGILQARTLEWVASSFSNAWKWKVKVKSLSRVWPSATPWTAAFQSPPFMGFSRQEYWNGVPLPSPGLQSMGLQKGQTQLRDQTTSTTLPRSSISGSTVDVWIHLFVQWILIKHLPWACSCSQHQSVSVKKTGRIMLTETSQNSGGHRQ